MVIKIGSALLAGFAFWMVLVFSGTLISHHYAYVEPLIPPQSCAPGVTTGSASCHNVPAENRMN